PIGDPETAQDVFFRAGPSNLRLKVPAAFMVVHNRLITAPSVAKSSPPNTMLALRQRVTDIGNETAYPESSPKCRQPVATQKARSLHSHIRLPFPIRSARSGYT